MRCSDDVSIESIGQTLLSSNSCILHTEDFEKLGLEPDQCQDELYEYLYPYYSARDFDLEYCHLSGNKYLYRITLY